MKKEINLDELNQVAGGRGCRCPNNGSAGQSNDYMMMMMMQLLLNPGSSSRRRR